ncbi:Gamma-glutamylputrescine oxidoreductase [Thalassovita autumnalis]|uniref:Gamma-glutamylputrescine oxidoreductase n=1 Tax=Thalassovita autumnalis TaxID=2072972 RepID=A0A0P1FQR4_9RHOB|nr:FAD-binding oxidoreductase [Thalassovita autumnalis]CUH64860.1 Gamma-glutamylputrescine oxidoreductase [Thalassovita autumnalis]CUH70789.1 Gamma-glutamylputrescine oxidoreductase [Thalassovita autumnalis]
MDLLTVNDTPGQYPTSYYAAMATPLPPFSPPQGQIDCDVCVIGGGFMGLSTALNLAERGYDVVLLEAQRVGFGASGRNGGQVGQGQRLDQDELEDLVGKDHARELWTIANQSVDLVRKRAASPLVEAEFADGIIHADHRKRFVPHSKAYAERLNSDYGYDKIRFIDREECRHLVNSPEYHGGTLDMGAGHIDPLQYALGLARMAQAAGVRIFEQARVTAVNEGEPATVDLAGAQVRARHVVMGMNGYLGKLNRRVAGRVMPINNYVVATAPMSAEQQEDILRNNHAVADSKFVVNYFRFSPDHRLLFGGTESYRYKFPSDIAGKVRKPLEEIFPQLKGIEIDYAWGGTLGITMNRMPHFERLSGNILSLSGFSGHGVAMASLAGEIAAETIAGQAERFDIMAKVPGMPFPGGPALRSPLLMAAMLWYSLRDKL